MQSQFETECWICLPQSVSSKKTSQTILKLLKIIQNEKRKGKKLISLPSELYFKQLVDYLKLDFSKNKTSSNECHHKVLKNYVTKKLEMTLDELHCLSQHIFNGVSKRKFQLELIEKIAKNMHQRVFQSSTNQKKSETSIKNTLKIKHKQTLDAQVPTVHTIQSQKGQQKRFINKNQQFSKLIDNGHTQNSTEFQDQIGLCLPNYLMGHNSMYPPLYGSEFSGQGFNYSMANIRMLISSGYFMGQMGSMNN